jgi:hypothetical protein
MVTTINSIDKGDTERHIPFIECMLVKMKKMMMIMMYVDDDYDDDDDDAFL